jgi:hypothetical protein
MRTVWLRHGRFILLSLFIGSHAAFIGCNDDSKTSGTQVPENPEAVARRKSKVEAYKSALLKKQAKPTGKTR